MVLLVLQAPVDHLVQVVSLAHRGRLGLKASKAHKDPLGHKDHLDQLAIKEKVVTLVPLVLQGHPDLRARLV